jgi:hypothetical protein
VALAYFVLVPGAFQLVREYRNSNVSDPTFTRGYPAQHALWHSAYIGLGYLPNKWGIQYRDEAAIETVKRVRPNAGYLTAAYSEVLRDRYGRVLEADAGGWVETEASKAVVLVRNALPYLLPVLAALALILAAGWGGPLLVRSLLLTAPAVALGILPVLLTVPYRPYELGLFAALGVMLLIAWATLVDRAGDVRPAIGRMRATIARPAALASVAAAVLLLGAAFVVAGPIQSRASQWAAKPLHLGPLP